MDDIFGLQKLVEYVASGIGSAAGTLFAPLSAHRRGKALEIEAKHRTKALAIIAEGHRDALAIMDNPEAELSGEFSIRDSVEQMVSFQQERRMGNIASVAYRAADLLSDADTVPDQEPDHDWTARFFNDVQDVSSEEMQELWARVLAGQVERPGSTSVKALDILRNMDQETARLFERLCSLSVSMVLPSNVTLESRVISLGKDAAENSLEEFNLFYNRLNLLNEHGLIISGYNSWRDYKGSVVQDRSVDIPLRYQNSFWALLPLDEFEQGDNLKIRGVAFTEAGKELSAAVNIHIVPQYDEALRAYFKSLNLELVRMTGYEPG